MAPSVIGLIGRVSRDIVVSLLSEVMAPPEAPEAARGERPLKSAKMGTRRKGNAGSRPRQGPASGAGRGGEPRARRPTPEHASERRADASRCALSPLNAFILAISRSFARVSHGIPVCGAGCVLPRSPHPPGWCNYSSLIRRKNQGLLLGRRPKKRIALPGKRSGWVGRRPNRLTGGQRTIKNARSFRTGRRPPF